ncbi:MAG: patatin-like phospholipase family protein [FCB group bacterium]|nr:patatin-like phospholipase family protein [FCB group bacterium]
MSFKQYIHRHKLYSVGLALGGGGALGLAHVGVLKALEEFDVRPKIISGNSAGALVGGLYASGKSVDELIDLSQEMGDDMFDHFKMSLRGGLVNAKRIHEKLLDILGDVHIEDAPIPFIAVSVDLISGKTFYIHRGRLADAIRASISVPGVFRPYHTNGLQLVDGGVRDSVPLRALDNYSLKLRIAVVLMKASLQDEPPALLDITPEEKKEEEKEKDSPGILKVISRSMAISSTESAFREIRAGKPDLSIYIDLGDKMKMWDFKRHEMAIKTGYEQAFTQLNTFFGK